MKFRWFNYDTIFAISTNNTMFNSGSFFFFFFFLGILLDSAVLVTAGETLIELRVGGNFTLLSCRQTGVVKNGEVSFEDPVFVVQSAGPGGSPTIITPQNDTKYFMATGQIKFSSTRPGGEPVPNMPKRIYYLGVSDISLQDDGTKYICISERDSRNQDEVANTFQDSSTTLKVKPTCSKLDQ